MERCFKYHNELSVLIKCEEFLEQLNHQYLFNNDYTNGVGSVRFVCSFFWQTSAGDVCFCVGSNRLAHIEDVFWIFAVHPSHTYSADVSCSTHNKHDNMPVHCGGRVRVRGSHCGLLNGRAEFIMAPSRGLNNTAVSAAPPPTVSPIHSPATPPPTVSPLHSSATPPRTVSRIHSPAAPLPTLSPLHSPATPPPTVSPIHSQIA